MERGRKKKQKLNNKQTERKKEERSGNLFVFSIHLDSKFGSALFHHQQLTQNAKIDFEKKVHFGNQAISQSAEFLPRKVTKIDK